MPSDLKDQKEIPTCAAEKFLLSQVTESSQSPEGGCSRTSPGTSTAGASSGEDLGGPGKEGPPLTSMGPGASSLHSPLRSWGETGPPLTHLANPARRAER